MATNTIESTASAKNKEELNDQEKTDAIKLEKIDRAIAECRNLYHTPFISDRTKQMYDDMLEEVRAKKNAEWAEQNVQFLQKTIKQAEAYYSVYREKLDEAARNKWISDSSRTQWIDRFFDGNLLEMDRKEWLFNKNRKDAFPAILANWKDVAEKRTTVIDLAKDLGVSDKDVPELRDLLNQDAFLSFHYNVRVHKTAKVKALVLAKHREQEGLADVLAHAEEQMEAWSKAGIMHSLKIGQWLERIAESKDPKKFISSVVLPYKKRWASVRARYNTAVENMEAQDMPTSYNIISPDAFLLLDYHERISYCALLESHNTELDSKSRTLASLTVQIQTLIDQQDAEGARACIKNAMDIDPENEELRYLNTLIDQISTQEDTENDPSIVQLQEQAHALIQQLPAPLRELYNVAAMQGVDALNTVMRSVHNRIRWHQTGSMNERTEERLRLEGNTHPTNEESPFIENADSPALVVLERLTMKKTDKAEEEDTLEEQETTLIAPISYAAQYDAVSTVHTPLKQTIKQLEKLNIPYKG